MSVLQKKTEFYKGERDREVIVIEAGVWERELRASSSKQVFPLWGLFPPTKFFPFPTKDLVPPIVT